MPELRVRFGISGRALDGSLTALGQRLSDLSTALETAGRMMLMSVARNFAAQGRPEKWAPLARSTAVSKGGGTILRDTGALMGSIGFSAGPCRLDIWAAVPYASVHQEGGRGIPGRPFLVFQPEDVDEIMRLAAGFILSGNDRW